MNINFCLECAAPLKPSTATDYVCSNGHTYYNNPRSGASIVFMRHGKILLAKRGIEPYKGKYGLPGGFLNYGEEAEAAAKREAMEETSLTIHSCHIIAAHTVQYIQNETAISLVYFADSWSGEITAHDDVAKLVWRPIDDIEGPDFAWHYPGLAATLHTISEQSNR